MSIKTAPWDEYSYKVQMLIDKPKNYSIITAEEVKESGGELFTHVYGSQGCGEQITLHWVVDSENDAILMSRFTQFGSPASIAANDMMALLCRNKTVDKAVDVTYKGLEYFLRDNPNSPALPEQSRYAVSFALDAVKSAVAAFYKEDRSGDEYRIVAEDSPMCAKSIQETIELHKLTTIEEITHYTKAGLYDKASIEPNSRYRARDIYLSQILKNALEALEAEKRAKMMVLDTPFRQMDTESQIASINKAIDDTVRQFLVMDGGDIEILDVKENGPQIDVYIRYIGACNGCASSSTSTLFAIETTLKDKIDDQIRVLPI